MIRSRLPVVMAEQGKFRVAEVSRDTGIGKTTLLALYHGKSKGIQFETLDTLCRYFGVNVNDLLEYVEVEDRERRGAV